MGHKVNPIGLRLTINRNWVSRWYADKKNYGILLEQDYRIRKFIKDKISFAGIPSIEIERAANKIKIIINAARPGLVIGRKGAEIDKLKSDIFALIGQKETALEVEIREVRNPEIEAQLIAENIAQQLVRRVSHKRAMKKALSTVMASRGAEGIKILCSGRLGGAEIARSEKYKAGKVPLHTLRAVIDYGFAEAFTTYGSIGIKVWIFKGYSQFGKSREGDIKDAVNA